MNYKLLGLAATTLFLGAAVLIMQPVDERIEYVKSTTSMTATVPETIPAQSASVDADEATSMVVATSPDVAEESPLDQQKNELAGIFRRVPVNEDGTLARNDNTKNFLNTLYNGLAAYAPEQFDSQAMQQLQDLAREAVPGMAGEELATLVQTYFHYRDEEKGQLIPEADGEQLATMFQNIVDLRRTWFGPEQADALFGEEETMAKYVIAMRLMDSDVSLSKTDKAARSKALQQDFVADFSKSVSASTLSEIESRSKELRKQGYAEDEIFAMQVNAVGRAKAEDMIARNQTDQ